MFFLYFSSIDKNQDWREGGLSSTHIVKKHREAAQELRIYEQSAVYTRRMELLLGQVLDSTETNFYESYNVLVV